MKSAKRIFLLFALCFGFSVADTYGIEASVNLASFKGEEQPYVEVSLYLIGISLTRQRLPDSKDTIRNSQVMIEIRFLRDSQVLHFDKYALLSPNSIAPANFLDVRRYSMPAGIYDVQIYMEDRGNPKNNAVFTNRVKLVQDEGSAYFSDIQLLASFKSDTGSSNQVKNGFRLEDLPYHFYGPDFKMLNYYAELYDVQTIADSNQYLTAIIVEKLFGNGTTQVVKSKYQRKQAKAIEVFLGQIDITDLPSGNYQFCIRVIDKNKKPIIYACVPFQRSNPKAEKQFQNGKSNESDSSFVAHLSLDSLRYSLKAIAPIVDQSDIEYLNLVIEGRNENAQKTFLYNFWYSYNPLEPGKDYQDYMKVARVVDQQFRHGFGYGFESDRGFMYLRYGRPDQLVNVIDDPSAPPYEIWTYSRLEKTKQSNVKFIFYNPSLAEGMYVLLHSTARGELQNPNWQRLLYKNATNVLDGVDANDPNKMKDNWNRNADRYFIDN